MPADATAARRSRLRRTAAGLGVGLALLGAAACSTPAPSQPDLSAALVDSGLSKKVADCTASALTGSLTKAELAELTERGAGGAPVDDPKKDNESYDKLVAAMSTCRDLQVASQPTTTTTTADPNLETSGAGTPTTVAAGTDGAQLNPASSTTTAP